MTKIILAGFDFFFFIIGPLVAAALISLFWGDLYNYVPKNEIEPRLISHFLLGLICVAWFWLRLHHYSHRKPFWLELKEILRTIIICAVIDLAIVAFSKWYLSRYVWVLTWSFTLALLPLGRCLARRLLIRLGLWQIPSVIIGCGPNAQDAYLAITSEKNLGFDIQYFFSTHNTNLTPITGIPLISSEDELWQRIDAKQTQFFIALEFSEEHEREQWIKRLATHPCRAVSIIPATRGVPLDSTDMSFIFSHEILILRINNSLTRLSSRVLKRTFDLLGSIALITVLSPVLIALAALVRRDGGHALYGHERIGQDGRSFKCLKFRSMVLNSQQVLDELLARDPVAREEWARDFKLKNDPRITKVGQFIRKTSLDELPQLWNVLKGEMSLVGPRPVVAEELRRYAEYTEYYLLAKPGMTGLWQVSGRNDVDYDKRVYFDAWYVKNWSLWNDVAILFKTISVVLKRDGAY